MAWSTWQTLFGNLPKREYGQMWCCRRRKIRKNRATLEAILAVQVQWRCMNSAGTSRTALEAVQGHGPDMPRLQSHGIECWALKDVIECRTESKARKGRLIGFEEGLGAYAR